MGKILLTGSHGQIGTELADALGARYGADAIVVSDVKADYAGPYTHEVLDVTDGHAVTNIVRKHDIKEVYHLAAILSAAGEKHPDLLWRVNMDGLKNVLDVAKENRLKVFVPSSIAAFGPSTPMDMTPQTTIQRPTTMYGISKVAGELLCDYYFKKYGVDTRGVRFPGIISHKALPGGGTTDYAVHIYYEAIKSGRYTSYIDKGTMMDMLYMPDAIEGVLALMEADGNKLNNRNAYNITAMSFDPEQLAASIKKEIPEFTLDYAVDDVRQAIANTWPNSLDDHVAREEWGWNPKFDIDAMTKDMLYNLKLKLK
ncbi:MULTISPECIES: NAD-dependent epimerase/dehydratase family protein [unclassified Fusibacter]|uniref:NAD-dependent epimerase/dehydratase family protein n=1 Tax=unclassified Fusibacter TaxID=2624464 RepID=UPI0019D6F7F8|nr:NAD-dependent epimerase/dehydratase family protein [Fusibacter sp. A1]MCK8060774.1 NAD-dependent epimerase/dehydratase family protein [Fusibacter sp. A2]